MFKLDILTMHKEMGKSGEVSCFLCKGNIREYIESLPVNFMDYDIQREITSNIYLDKLIDTVTEQKHIPSITLLEDDFVNNKDSNELKIINYRILDGLQRTYRLNIINETFKLIINEMEAGKDLKSLSKFKLSQLYKDKLSKINSSIIIFDKILNALFQKYSDNLQVFKSEFLNQDQWFEVWFNLSVDEEVEKMLLLNAGHKTVSTKHQLELLFIRLLPEINNKVVEEKVKVQIVREKDISTSKFAKERKLGTYHFSHIIASALSFSNGKPTTVNRKLILDVQEGLGEDGNIEKIDYHFINSMIEFLVKLDLKLSDRYGELGEKWVSRETVLVGLFGAMGAYIKRNFSSEDIFTKMLNIIEYKPNIFNIKQYEHLRTNLDLSKVNIGNKTKNSVYNGVLEILNDDTIYEINWEEHF